MALRICLVTPFAWSQPHDVNEHVRGVARELRALGHSVTVLAPSTRATELLDGRRALVRGGDADVIALGPAVPVSRRSRMGVPVGVRANLSLALAVGSFDVVHGLEPALPSLSYLALRDAEALAVASFFSPERLAYPPGRAQRERLLARIDALVASSPAVAAAAGERFPGEYAIVPPGVDSDLFRPRRRRLVVIPGEEIKTDGQGEVIGLFLSEEIPRGMSFADTVAAIRAQGGLVYLPHPFDRLHAIPDAATLRRHLADVDVFEVYNARLLFDAYNDEALRFARKYNLTAGAGSDAHVLQGVGTGALRMRAFDGPEEFLVSLRTAEVLRRPKSLVYLQGLKWVAQAKERVR